MWSGKRYGETYDAAVRATGYGEGHLKNCRAVALAVPPEERDARLRWAHDKAVLPVKDPKERRKFLREAATAKPNPLSVRKMEIRIEQEGAKESGDGKSQTTDPEGNAGESCPTCGRPWPTAQRRSVAGGRRPAMPR